MPGRKPISIVLLGDSPSAHDGVAAVLRAQPGFRVLLVSATILEALRTVRTTRPDIVVLNLVRGHGEILTLAGALHGEVPDSRVIIVGLELLRDDLVSFVRARVSGVIMADASCDTVLDTIHLVAQGTQVLPSDLTRSLFGQLKRSRLHGRPEALNLKGFGHRDRAVADLVVQGFSNREIASQLQLARHTVTSHVHRVLSKLAVNIRLEAGACSRNGPDSAIVPRGDAVCRHTRPSELVPKWLE
jgi:two-component system nitrate/nitrite response regulator NarL